MSNFELKLNYLLLRQKKFTKKESAKHKETAKSNTQQWMYQNMFVKNRMNIRASFILFSLIMFVIYIFWSMLSGFILMSHELDY